MYVLFATVIVTGFLLWNERTAAFQSGCVGNYCFIMSEYAMKEILNQTDAQQWCRNNGSQLAEIVSQDVQDAIELFIRDKSRYKPDIGWFFKTDGIRSSGNWSRLSGREMGSITVLEHSNGVGLYYGYLEYSTPSFDIYAATPTEIKGYICADNSDCSDGKRMDDGQCYRSYTQTGLSWYDARNQCLNRSGDLASFDNINSNAGFRQMNTSWLNTSFSYWIGFRRESWTWQGSDSDVKYSNWQRGQPGINIDCLCLFQPTTDNSSSLQWFPCGCDSLIAFLCLSVQPTSRLPDNSGPTDSPNRPSESNESSSGLSLEAQVAIGVAVGVGGLVLIVVVVFIIVAIILNKKHRDKRTSKEKPTAQVKQKKQKQTKEPIYMTTIEKGEKGEGVEQEGDVGREDDKKGGEEDEKGEEDVKGGEEDEKGGEEGDEEGKEGEKGGEGEEVSIEGDKIVGLYGTVPQTEDQTEDLDSTSMSHQHQEQEGEDQPQTLYQTFEIVENSGENPDEDERHSIRSQIE